MEHRAQECQSYKYIHGDRHLETNSLTFIHQRKRPTEAKGLVQFYIKFQAEPRLEFNFPIRDLKKEMRFT